MRNTRVAGHGLNYEGKPFVISERTGRPVSPAYYTPSGFALCECGWMSEVLESNGQRKKAHAAHKDEIRAAVSPDKPKEGNRMAGQDRPMKARMRAEVAAIRTEIARRAEPEET